VRSRRPLQNVVTAIRLGVSVKEAGDAFHANGERHLRRIVNVAKIYPADLLAETVRIANLCNFDLGTLRYEYPAEIVPHGHTPTTYLRELTEAGMQRRFPQGAPENVRKVVERELS